jgi:hypothetical protein
LSVIVAIDPTAAIGVGQERVEVAGSVVGLLWLINVPSWLEKQ